MSAMLNLLAVLALFVGCTMIGHAEAADSEPSKKHKLSVEFTTPSSAVKAAITEAREVGKEIWVRVDILGAGGIGLAVISKTKATAEITGPDKPIKYFVFGKTWSWKNEEKGITFLKDLPEKEAAEIEKKYKEGKVLYTAKK
ncbi:MAG: hypothetical protein SNJ82_04945 [Gemmataceae bacterium]